jgi:hypothetical protein
MKRTLIVAVLWLVVLLIPAVAKKKPATCANDLGSCPREGCSESNRHDLRLNRIKNTKSTEKPVTDRSLTWMKDLHDPQNYKRGGPRAELTNLGEGQNIRVVGYLLAVKLELGGESCNCYLHTVEETDNHLVLVNPDTVKNIPLPQNASAKTLKAKFLAREAQSITAEFTPRVRAEGHPNFTNAKLQPLINKTPQGALFVRVTGLLMFDSEHFRQNELNRVNSWEIHPIMKLEFCPTGKTCKKDSDANWQDLDALP